MTDNQLVRVSCPQCGHGEIQVLPAHLEQLSPYPPRQLDHGEDRLEYHRYYPPTHRSQEPLALLLGMILGFALTLFLFWLKDLGI